MQALTPSTLPMSVDPIDLIVAVSLYSFWTQAYANGLSEVVLGKAIKQHNLPRDEIVILTKVS